MDHVGSGTFWPRKPLSAVDRIMRNILYLNFINRIALSTTCNKIIKSLVNVIENLTTMYETDSMTQLV